MKANKWIDLETQLPPPYAKVELRFVVLVGGAVDNGYWESEGWLTNSINIKGKHIFMVRNNDSVEKYRTNHGPPQPTHWRYAEGKEMQGRVL